MSEDRLTILEMEYRIVAGRLNVIEAELAKINMRLDRIGEQVEILDDRLVDLNVSLDRVQLRTEGVERGVTALLRHFNLGEEDQ